MMIQLNFYQNIIPKAYVKTTYYNPPNFVWININQHWFLIDDFKNALVLSPQGDMYETFLLFKYETMFQPLWSPVCFEQAILDAERWATKNLKISTMNINSSWSMQNATNHASQNQEALIYYKFNVPETICFNKSEASIFISMCIFDEQWNKLIQKTDFKKNWNKLFLE